MAVETKEYRAEAKFQRVSPQKARLVLELIKGRGVQEALETAAFTKKRIAPVIHKLLTSAVDNAKYVSGEQGTDLDVDNLYVRRAIANDGPRMKRIRPAPMGRAYRYQRRLTHIIVSVAEREGAASHLVTKVDEPATTAETSAAGPKAAKAGKAKTAAKPKAAPKARAEAKKPAAKKSAPKKSAKKDEK
ncbi:MAG TPA: 50S ribosomal protein L22 [Terracidiphilus sp.]|jgi:large subunit ribosomal protein L22|nr:50S ribosomal protein L22 [Terracidiphilus sp.]